MMHYGNYSVDGYVRDSKQLTNERGFMDLLLTD
jgi:hypothetical protein